MEAMLEEGCSLRAVARKLGRSPNSISLELRLGQVGTHTPEFEFLIHKTFKKKKRISASFSFLGRP